MSREQARVLLTEKQFVAWDLHERGMGYLQIARALEIGVPSARDRIRAARHRLSKHEREAA